MADLFQSIQDTLVAKTTNLYERVTSEYGVVIERPGCGCFITRAGALKCKGKHHGASDGKQIASHTPGDVIQKLEGIKNAWFGDATHSCSTSTTSTTSSESSEPEKKSETCTSTDQKSDGVQEIVEKVKKLIDSKSPSVQKIVDVLEREKLKNKLNVHDFLQVLRDLHVEEISKHEFVDSCVQLEIRDWEVVKDELQHKSKDVSIPINALIAVLLTMKNFKHTSKQTSSAAATPVCVSREVTKLVVGEILPVGCGITAQLVFLHKKKELAFIILRNPHDLSAKVTLKLLFNSSRDEPSASCSSHSSRSSRDESSTSTSTKSSSSSSCSSKSQDKTKSEMYAVLVPPGVLPLSIQLPNIESIFVQSVKTFAGRPRVRLNPVLNLWTSTPSYESPRDPIEVDEGTFVEVRLSDNKKYLNITVDNKSALDKKLELVLSTNHRVHSFELIVQAGSSLRESNDIDCRDLAVSLDLVAIQSTVPKQATRTTDIPDEDD